MTTKAAVPGKGRSLSCFTKGNIMKKWIAALAAGFLLAMPVSAAETADLALLSEGELVTVFFDAGREAKFTEQEACFYGILEESIAARREEISIAKAGYTDPAEMLAFLQDTLNTEAAWNRVDDEVRYITENGVITTIILRYYAEPAMIAAADGFTTIADGVAHALAEVKTGMTTLEKITVLHDYLVREVDYEIPEGDEYSFASYSEEGVFINRIAVCNGYARAYSHLLQEIGVSSYVLASEVMNHAWNLVSYDGSWYHVDTTWDDPVNWRGGFVYHKYFMRSDAEFKDSLEHYDWFIQSPYGDTAPAASVSGAFTGYIFRVENDMDSAGVPMLNYRDGYYYFLNSDYGGNTLIKAKFDGSERTETALSETMGYMFLVGDKLYANTRSRVYEMDLNGTILRTVAVEADGTITNFWLKLDTLAYEVTYGDGTAAVFEIDLTRKLDELVTVNGMEFYLNEKTGEATLLSYNGSASSITIPKTVGACTVTAIGAEAFADYKKWFTVTIPDTVTRIGASAFEGSYVKALVLPDSIVTIEDSAFWNCNYIYELTSPASVRTIGDEAFEYCYNLRDVRFEGKVPETFGADVFHGVTESGSSTAFTLYCVAKNGWVLTTDEAGVTTWTDAYGASYRAAYYIPDIAGDLNADGVADNDDVRMLAEYFAGYCTEMPFNKEDADMNADGELTREDCMRLARKVAGW